METRQRKVIVYTKTDGSRPFIDWLDAAQDRRIRDAIESRITRVKLGNYGDHKRLRDGIIELRFIKLGLRVYIAEVDNIIVLILCGGNKNTKGDQSRDIAKAVEYLTDFKKEQHHAKDK